jgi:hypothetical protein
MDAVPATIAGVIGTGLLATIKILWADRQSIKKDCEARCTAQLAEKNAEIAALKAEHAKAIATLKQEHSEEEAKLEVVIDEYKGRWVREIQHGANLALLPRRPNEPPPESLPPPDYDEPAEAGQMREEVQRAILGQRRREYEASSSNRRAVAPPEVLRRGMRGHPLVKLVQMFLRTQNLYRDPIDGDFSSETEAAVRHFQDVAGLSVTGIVDTPTWGALFVAGFQMPTGSRPKMPSRPR